MNEDPLDSLLRSVPEPPVSSDDSDAFARRVRRRLQDPPTRNTTPVRHPLLSGFLAEHARGLAAAAVLAVAAWGVLHGIRPAEPTSGEPVVESAEVQAYREVWAQFAALFPHQVRAVTFGPEGPRVVLSDSPDLPESPAILVRLCSRDGCRTALTSSGQTLDLGSQRLEVLGTSDGGVLVATDRAVWPLDRTSLHLSARHLASNL